MEEQLHRASNARLYQDPNHSVMQLHSRYTDLDCLADGHSTLISDCLGGDRNSVLLMKKGSFWRVEFSIYTFCVVTL